jgi:hypothetical protein
MPLFTLSSLTCHRFVITSITVSSKGLCDAFCPNNLYARVGGISLSELNVLEREFLQMIDWRLMVSRIFSLSTSGFCASACLCSRILRLMRSSSFFSSCQCSCETLQEYYVNLVRTHSGNLFYIAGADSPSSSSDSDDVDLDSGGSSPTAVPQQPHPSAVLLEHGSSTSLQQDVSQRPTVEQNMAFAALQQSQDLSQMRR